MSGAIFPIVFASEEARLLTAILLGFLFGFALERAGFGNARKLVGQFYLHDMTVFKVMFTAVLVAMVGLYSLSAFGFVDMSRMWINPTFVWAQLIGGFMLGIGFIMSGLCPGTSVVSAASGRWDGLVTFAGIFVGSFAFALFSDWFPILVRLYEGGSLGLSVLPQLLRISVPWFILGVVLLAGAAFIGAEKVERIFQRQRRPVDLTPEPTRRARRYKFALAGSLALVALVASGASAPRVEQPQVRAVEIEPLELAEAIIAKDPWLLILDLRGRTESPGAVIPGAIPISADQTAVQYLQGAAPETVVVLCDETGTMAAVPSEWPQRLDYRIVAGGMEGWRAEVLTPVQASSSALAEREFVARQNQIAGFFSGAAVRPSVVSAPPVVSTLGPKKKKKSMGC